MADKVPSDLPAKPDDEIAAPDPDARKEFDAREEYRGFKMPRGMSLPQRRAWRKSIDEREVLFRRPSPGTDEQLEPTAFQRKFPRYADDVIGDTYRGVKKSVKDTAKEMFKEAEVLPELGKTVGGALIDAATVVPRTKAAIQSDPKGSLEFVGKAFSGDREAGKKLATKASEGIAEPFATMGDVALAKYAAEEGDYGTAALYGGLILVPSVVQTLGKSMSKGWLKSAAEAGEEIPDEAAKKMNDLAKRVDEGKVADDMQVRRELAQIEDDYRYEYMVNEGADKRIDVDLTRYSQSEIDSAVERLRGSDLEAKISNEKFFAEGEGRPVNQQYIDSAQKELDRLRSRNLTDEEIAKYIEGRRYANRLFAEEELEDLALYGRPQGGGTPGGVGRTAENKMLREISTRDAFGRTSGGRLFKIEDGYIEAADLDDAARLATDDDGFYHYLFARGLDEPDDIRSAIKEASPEESAKYFELKRQNPRGLGRVPEFTEDDGIDKYKQLVMSYADEGRPFSFTEVFTDRSQPFDLDLYEAVDELLAEGRISGPSTDLKLDKFGNVLGHNTMIYTKAPGGGEVKDLFPHKNLLDKAQKSGLKIPRHLRGASGKELLDRPVGTPKEFDNPGFVNMIESRGLDTDYLNQLNQYLTTKRNTLKKEYDDQLRLAYDDYPNNINTAAIEEADKLRLELEQFSRAYDESTNSMSGKFIDKFALAVEVERVDFGPIEQAIGLNSQIINFGNKLEAALMDEITTPAFRKNPVTLQIKDAFDQVVTSIPSDAGKRDAFKALEEMFDDFQDPLKAQQLLTPGVSDSHNQKRFTTKLTSYMEKYGTPSGGSRSIDDLEGPSEAEIQQMIEQGRFGDPEQLEILKEDMRRMAELEQQGQIARSNIRSTRTPGTPGEFSRSTEGTSRAERKGGKRERPKPKTKKDKYEN